MTKRVFNFSPGPAVLPEPVLEQVRDNILSFGDTGIGILEHSHRGPAFEGVLAQTKQDLRDLLSIGENFEIIFCTGGATNQFSMVPLNLRPTGQVADYLVTGTWAEKAIEEAARFGEVHEASSSKDRNHAYIPTKISLSSNPAYVHFTSNNTIYGTQYQSEPEVGKNVLICDASSDLLHKKVDINKYGMVYAGAQKNLGPAGTTVVVIRKDLLERIPGNVPVMLDYRTYTKNDSLYNTPPTFAIYVVGEVLKWIKGIGGLEQMEKVNREKAGLLYSEIDRTGFYVGHADKDSRSLMNVTFRIKNHDLEPAFIKEAKAAGLGGLGGHRSVGGLRASIYNAFPKAGVEALVKFMREFEAKNG